MRKRIYLSPPHMSGREIKLVEKVFRSNWIAPVGPDVDAFEREFAVNNGSRYAVALATGTSAVHLALKVAGVGRGDTVICSDLTFCASASPIIYRRAKPVFIDSDEVSWNMDPGLLEEELKRCSRKGKLPKAVVVTHLYGQSADLGAIKASCRRYSVPLVEDAAEALGALYKGKRVGNAGVTGVFSFNGNKIITASAGGMLVTGNRKIAEEVKYLSTQARDPAPHYQHSEIGFNYRMSNILAAVGRGQLKVLGARVRGRRRIFDLYRKCLGKLPGIEFMPEPEWSRGNRWLTCMLVDPKEFGADREKIRRELEKYNIESRPLWKPMHMQPVFRGCRTVGGKVSEKLFRYGLCLPSGTAMKDRDIRLICGIIRKLSK